MSVTDPAAHAIVERASRGHDVDEAKTKQERLDRDAVEMFLIRAASDMLRRMRDGLRRGWGAGWKAGYSDDEVIRRVFMAEQMLETALINFRLGAVGIDEVRKRAADVANQAFMLADPERLRNSS